eukprot:815250-Pelagomonas_calceolata.AAC.1
MLEGGETEPPSQKGSFIKSWKLPLVELQDDCYQWGDVPHSCQCAERLGDGLVYPVFFTPVGALYIHSSF